MGAISTEGIDADTPVQDGLEDILDSVSGNIVVVNPSREMIRGLVRDSDRLDEFDSVQILTSRDAMKEVRDDFVLAARLQQLIADETAAVRVDDDLPAGTPIIVSESEVVAVISTPAGSFSVEGDDGEVAARAYESYSETWESGDQFSFRTPPLRHFRETFREEFDEEAEQDLVDLLEHLNDDPEFENSDMDVAVASLLVAAKHELMLYDLGRWGENSGVASRATFSRSKTSLENQGLIDTADVPIEVGRPRLRLLLNEDEVPDDSIEGLAGAVKSYV